MTLIACFSDSLVENVAVCLRLLPEKLILVGDGQKMAVPIQRYCEFFRQRGLHIRVTPCDIHGKKMTEISSILTKIVRSEKECIVDLTGSDEVVAMAVGAMLAGLDQNQRKHISIQRFHLEDGSVTDFDNDGKVIAGVPAELSARELICLHGGIIHPGTYQPPEEYTPADLKPLWDIAAQRPKDWNKTLCVLGEFESRSDSKTQIFLPLQYIRSSISNFEEKEALVRSLLEEFRKKGLIKDQSNADFLNYSYSNPLIRYCTQKAGNVLEVKTLLEARELRKKGRPYFHDCHMSVNIDWDGVVHNPAERIPETRNEVDVILTHGLTPLFISCKNGTIGEEELYKLHTVATRFGGPYARKMLIVTDLDRKSQTANRAFIQRAWDMDVFLVTDAAELSGQEWQDIFKQAML